MNKTFSIIIYKFLPFSLIAAFLLIFSSFVWADTYIKLYVGEVKPMTVGKVARVAVGKEGIIRPIILDDGKVLLIPTAAGETDVKMWLKNGKQLNYKLRVMQANMGSRRAIANSLLRTFPGLRVRAIDKYIIVEGKISPMDKKIYESIIGKIGDVVSLVNPNRFDEYQVRQLLKAFHVDGVQITKAGKRMVISGEVDPGSLKALQSVTSKIPNITSLVKPKLFINKRMVRLRAHVIDIDSSYAQQLGVEWNKSASGPNFSMVTPIITNKVFGVLPEDNVNWAGLLSGGNENVARMDLRFATSIFSKLQFLESNGHAKTLSRPELMARSGEVAKMHVGGKVPYAYSTSDGPQVSYIDYGVMLNMTPIVNSKNEILLKINAEVSSIVDTSSIAPAKKTVTASTVVNAYSGATIAIAGLLNVDESRNADKVPFLGNVPIVGRLFKNKGKNIKRREVVILVTPELVIPRTQNNAPHVLRQEIQRLETLQVPLDRDVKGPSFYTDIME